MSGDLCVAIWLCRFPGCAKHASGMRRACVKHGHSLVREFAEFLSMKMNGGSKPSSTTRLPNRNGAGTKNSNPFGKRLTSPTVFEGRLQFQRRAWMTF
jgi:hypothetical protein